MTTALVTALAVLAFATPARAQTCPGLRDPIHDNMTIDNKRDPVSG